VSRAQLRCRQLFQGREIQLDWNVQGNNSRNGRLVVGAKAGPKRSVSNLAHEMCHFVEIDDARCGEYGWGLRIPEVEIYGRFCAQPVTRQGTERECRVAALQHNLLQWLGVYRTPKCLVSAFHFLPDFCYVPGERDRGRLSWCEERVLSLIGTPEYSIDWWMAEWDRKDAVLRELQATKP
jgi:hypothetical protein